MSHPLLPKNLKKDQALFREGVPDFSKLDADAFPVPTEPEDQGAILEVTDTGDRYRWTGSVWVQVVIGGRARVMPFDYELAVTKGQVPGSTIRTVAGHNPLVGAAEKHLWGHTADMVFPTAAESWEVLSDNAADTFGGTGAEIILITYLDDNHNVQTVIKNLNGVTPVALNADHFRPDSSAIILSGTGRKNAGTITIRDVAVPANVRQIILPELSNSQDGFFTVPAGFTAVSMRTVFTYGKNNDGSAVAKFVIFGTNTEITTPRFPFYQNVAEFNVKGQFAVPEKTDIFLAGTSANPNKDVTALIIVELVDNNFL